LNNKAELQKEALRIIEQNDYNGIVIMGTGTGKGKVMVDIIKKLNPKTILYTCDNKLLRDITFKEEVIKWGGEEFLDRITMKCYQTTHKWKDKHFELLLADEGDVMSSEKHINTLKNNKFDKILIFTGTLRDDRREILEEYVPLIHHVTISEAEEIGAVNKANVHYVTYQLTALENNRYLGFNKRFKEILDKKELTNHDKFKLKQIQLGRKLFLQNLNSGRLATRELLKKLYSNHDNRILVFCGSTEQADKICRWSYHGKNEGLDYLNKFDANEIRVLSVVGKIDRGVNLKNRVNTVVFESPERSKTKIMQRSGRARRLETDEYTNIYFMIPYYRSTIGLIKPTIIWDYVLESGAELDLANAKTIEIKI
jgi:superfamily II DNA or RNA helicase